MRACPVQVKAGRVWACLGPMPAPLLPDWEPFSWPDGFVQVVIPEVPCNCLQCQENSIDPIHFEWILDSAVGRARAGCHRPRWQGANRSHGLCHGEDTQRRQRGRGQLDRVGSAVTRLVRPVVAGIFRPGKCLLAEKSGQLPNL